MYFSDLVPDRLMEEANSEHGSLQVVEDSVVPAFCALCVTVACDVRNSDRVLDTTVEPIHLKCMKNTLVPHCIASIVQGCTGVWVINYSTESVLPAGLKLAICKEYAPTAVAVLNDSPGGDPMSSCLDD